MLAEKISERPLAADDGMYIPFFQSLPSPRVAKPKPASVNIPEITRKLNNKPQTDTSQHQSWSSGAMVTLWIG